MKNLFASDRIEPYNENGLIFHRAYFVKGLREESETKEAINLNSEITNAVKAAKSRAQYDECAKRLLGQKSILAHILVNTVDEFKGMNPKDVIPYIEGEPQVGVVPIEPGLTNASDMAGHIGGFNSENAEINEGTVRFDIVFYVRMRDGISQIIVNIEAQKNKPVTYKILNRAIFYVSRLISSQKERDFWHSDYDDIKRVFSIWICMNMDMNSLSYIHLMKEDIVNEYDREGNIDLLNIVLLGVTNEVPKREERYELHRLISTLLSNEIEAEEKLNMIELEYQIPVSEELREEVNLMCNLSEGIEERAAEKAAEKTLRETNKKVITNMHRKGYTLEQIAEIVEIKPEEVGKIIEEESMSV